MNGLNVANKGLQEINKLAQTCVKEYLSNCVIDDDCILCESVTLQFEEFSHAIPQHLQSRFLPGSWYRCYSGMVEMVSPSEQHKENEYIVNAVLDESGDNLLLILLQQVDGNGDTTDILLKDYTG